MAKYIRWQILLTLLGIVLIGSVLFYLSWDEPAQPPKSYPTPSVETTVIPTRGGTYIEGIAGSPQFINPLFSELNDVDRDVCALIFEGLTRVNERNQIVPLLAERWDVSGDNLIYTFTLRDDVRWQDGEPFTGDDVVFTIGLMQHPDFPGLPYLAELWRSVQVEKLDQYTVRFTLLEPYAPFLDYTTIGLVPQHLLKDVPVATLDQDPFNYAPVGTGLFKLQELTADHIVLDTNPYHHQWAQTIINHVEIKFYPTYSHLYKAYEDGEIMGISRLLAQDIKTARQNPDLQLISARLSGYSLIFMNLQNPNKPFFQDQRVRQAMLYALDRQELIDQVLGGQGLIIHSPIMPQSWAYNPQVKVYPHSTQQARDLLDKAGWKLPDPNKIGFGELKATEADVRSKDGQRLEFTLLTNNVPDRVALANAIAEQWSEIGIQVYVQALSMSELTLDHLRPREFDAVLSQWQSLPPDPDAYPVWHSTQIEGGGQNYSGFVDRDADEAIEVARQLTDAGQRAELYYQFQEIFAEQVPAILLYQAVYTFGIDNHVRHVQIAPMPDPSGRYRSISDWAVQEQEVLVSDLNDQIGDKLDKRVEP